MSSDVWHGKQDQAAGLASIAAGSGTRPYTLHVYRNELETNDQLAVPLATSQQLRTAFGHIGLCDTHKSC